MKKQLSQSSIPFLYIMLLFAGCGSITGSGDTDQYIIDVVGAPVVLNCSKSYTLAGYYANEEWDTVSMVASAGDLLYFQLTDDEILCYRYDPGDGLLLSVRYDTVHDRFFINEKLISVSLTEGSAAWEWLARADDKVLRGIRSLYISLPLSESEIKMLEKCADSFSYPGLFIEGERDLERLLSLIEPGWLMAEDLNFATASAEVKANLRHLELLWHGGAEGVNADFLYGLPELNSLIIENWDSATLADFQFGKLKSLESLSLIECDMHGLSALDGSYGINNLNLIYCESLEEMSSVTDLSGIACLSLTGCPNIRDIMAIGELPALARLSLPGNITQEEFADILARQNRLQVLELIECDRLEDLTPLQDVTGLRALMLDSPIEDLTSIYGLSGLELLVLGGDYFDDSLALSDIRKALPDTKIVAGGGFCLGSGWILLIIPAILVMVLGRKVLGRSRAVRIKT